MEKEVGVMSYQSFEPRSDAAIKKLRFKMWTNGSGTIDDSRRWIYEASVR